MAGLQSHAGAWTWPGVRGLVAACALPLAACADPAPVSAPPPPPVEAPAPEPGRPVAPRHAPPPARGPGLTRAEVVAVARAAEDPAAAIYDLDLQRFAFALDAEALAWLEGQALAPEVVDYLRKRSRVDWEALRGDVDPWAEPPGR